MRFDPGGEAGHVEDVATGQAANLNLLSFFVSRIFFINSSFVSDSHFDCCCWEEGLKTDAGDTFVVQTKCCDDDGGGGGGGDDGGGDDADRHRQ